MKAQAQANWNKQGTRKKEAGAPLSSGNGGKTKAGTTTRARETDPQLKKCVKKLEKEGMLQNFVPIDPIYKCNQANYSNKLRRTGRDAPSIVSRPNLTPSTHTHTYTRL